MLEVGFGFMVLYVYRKSAHVLEARINKLKTCPKKKNILMNVYVVEIIKSEVIFLILSGYLEIIRNALVLRFSKVHSNLRFD